MPFRVGTNRIGRLVVGATVTPPPSSGLIGWFDAADYTSGTTWTDKSVNGLDLTLSGTYALDASTLGGPSLNISNGFGKSATTSLISGQTGTEYTHIEIVRPKTLATADATFAISANNAGDDPESISGYKLFGGATEIGYLITNTGGRSARLTGIGYNTTETWFVSRRLGYDSPSLGTNPIISVGSENNALVHYSSGYASAGAYTDYDLGSAGVMVVAAGVSSGNYKTDGYYAVNLFYNRFLSDAEIQIVYDYYKTTYNLA
jgi:hypothetical protein